MATPTGRRWPWFDFLSFVVRPVPVTVRGAFNFSLKSLAKAMHAAGLIETTWGDGPADGVEAMVGAWWCDTEAARIAGSMRDLDLMVEIGHYNEVDKVTRRIANRDLIARDTAFGGWRLDPLDAAIVLAAWPSGASVGGSATRSRPTGIAISRARRA